MIGSHELYKPECKPVTGRRWSYPGPERISSNRYELFAIGYDCAAAATWTKRLVRGQIPAKKSGGLSKIRGPRGFYCSAWPDASGHAYAGGCQKGHSAFGWNWNVANRRVVFAPDANGVVQLMKLGGTDAEIVLGGGEKGHYTVTVSNTSGVGFLTGFTWSPPPGMKITKVTKASGARCSLSGKGMIACSGKVSPPSCLCKGDGASVKIAFDAATPASRSKTVYGTVGARLTITAMTPVPYLIPGTPAAAKAHQTT